MNFGAHLTIDGYGGDKEKLNIDISESIDYS